MLDDNQLSSPTVPNNKIDIPGGNNVHRCRMFPVGLSGNICTRITSLIVIITLCLPSAQAQDTGAGLDFLNISPSTGLLGISEAQTASPAGAASIYTNPALLVFVENSVLDISYTLWISEVQNQFVAVNMRKPRSALAIGIYNSTSDNFLATDPFGGPTSSFNIDYLSIAGGWAYRIGNLAFGASGQYLREEVIDFRANGYAVSAGVAGVWLDNRLRIGAAVMNLGRMQDLNFEATPVPSTLGFGVDAHLIEFRTPGVDDLPILLSLHADLLKPLEDSPSSDFIRTDPREPFYSLGLTVDVAELILLRSGFRFGPTERPYSVGAGLNIDPVQVNYALVPFSTGFGTVHSIGLQYKF